MNLTLGEVKLTIAGKNKTLQMSVFTSAKGDYRSGNLYHNQKTEAFLDTHASFFEEWSSPDKTDSQLSDHGHFFVFLRAIIPYRRM